MNARVIYAGRFAGQVTESLSLPEGYEILSELELLPSGFDAEFVVTMFGTAAFERLSFLDRIATADSTLWERLRQRYALAESQRVRIDNGRPEEAAVEIHTLLEGEPTAGSVASTFSDDEERETPGIGTSAAIRWRSRRRIGRSAAPVTA